MSLFCVLDIIERLVGDDLVGNPPQPPVEVMDTWQRLSHSDWRKKWMISVSETVTQRKRGISNRQIWKYRRLDYIWLFCYDCPVL